MADESDFNPYAPPLADSIAVPGISRTTRFIFWILASAITGLMLAVASVDRLLSSRFGTSCIVGIFLSMLGVSLLCFISSRNKPRRQSFLYSTAIWLATWTTFAAILLSEGLRRIGSGGLMWLCGGLLLSLYFGLLATHFATKPNLPDVAETAT